MPWSPNEPGAPQRRTDPDEPVPEPVHTPLPEEPWRAPVPEMPEPEGPAPEPERTGPDRPEPEHGRLQPR